MTESEKKVDIKDSLPPTLEVGGLTLSLREVGREDKPASFRPCRVFCYDLEGDPMVDFMATTVQTLGISPKSNRLKIADGVNFVGSFISLGEPTLVFSAEGGDNGVCYDRERFSDGYFGNIWRLWVNEFRELKGKYPVDWNPVKGIVVVPVPPLPGQPESGGIVILDQKCMLEADRSALEQLLAGRKFTGIA